MEWVIAGPCGWRMGLLGGASAYQIASDPVAAGHMILATWLPPHVVVAYQLNRTPTVPWTAD